ncbi:Double-strand break repair protein AddB [Candidatus Filomicrobium marinum]|uniref:Double-strand break repair protein AddB n=1 Tax=Candidatus Filomicrobium marinum TaxID=1608628 RepID=A0A0D6JFA1_9HYPH|nr:double-strand break repair protein AddB [Candidatus Filomicrobium marinum]CFX19489.1 Double-strand break repair protein AddB [Candidatus Filomicrobium marinum]CPR18524.1 Double-strand break repair protein AddB [Candidatus Filomicrobium marinum]
MSDGVVKPGAVYTVPAAASFLDVLAQAVLNGDLPHVHGPKPDPLDLTALTILVPTRRAERAIGEAFMRAGQARALLLPRIQPVSQGDDDGALFSDLAVGANPDELEIPPAIAEMERVLLLTQLVQKWSAAMRQPGSDPTGELAFGMVPSAGARTPAQAANMARDLANLMDLVEREGCSLDGIADLVPDTFSEHWQKSLDFLKIITEYWPAILAARGRLSPKDRENQLILSQARRLTDLPPADPVIVAGVTGSIPATIELMRAVLQLPQGAIVLPALDLGLDDASWNVIPEHPEHPQFALRKLLDGLGLNRSDVRQLPGSELTPGLAMRETLISESMRPTATTGAWHHWVATADRTDVAEALSGVSLVEAPAAQDEAEAIALIMRHALETPNQTAALITPDRLLARRVAIRLEAWGIRVDDSAGRPFAKTAAGAFLELVINCLARNFAPPETMALLKHPLARLGLSAREVRFAAHALEHAVFRKLYLGDGIPGIEAALTKARIEAASGEAPRTAQRLWDEDWERARDLVARLTEAFAPLTATAAMEGELPLTDLAEAHLKCALALTRLPEEERLEAPGEPLFAGEAGQTAALFFEKLLASGDDAPDVKATDYPDLYRSLILGLNVVAKVPPHPRLSIWGPLEARLLRVDVTILASLNDGTWPDAADPGPWLNRPMRAALGLPQPEEAIGRAAHDFTSFLAAPKVIMTRARKVDGVPSVPSRWLLRLKALVAGLGLNDALEPNEPWLAWARLRDFAPPRAPAQPPRPTPPVEARPRKISVSGVERWIANPYAIYARHVLRLEPLQLLGAEPDAALRGAIIHEAMSRFAKTYPVRLPDDTARELFRIANDVMREHASHPRIAAFWLPRFERFATWFAETEPQRRDGLQKTLAEIGGELSFESAGGSFKLTARADRLDITNAGVAITDYKTGAPPNDRAVLDNTRPQLPLEAAIALEGGFVGVSEQNVSLLRYIRASGGEPPGEERIIKTDDLPKLAEGALEGLKRLVAAYDNPTMAYAAVRRGAFSYDYDDYAHLARVAEWAQFGEADGEAA